MQPAEPLRNLFKTGILLCTCLSMIRKVKYEARNPKSETNKKFE